MSPCFSRFGRYAVFVCGALAAAAAGMVSPRRVAALPGVTLPVRHSSLAAAPGWSSLSVRFVAQTGYWHTAQNQILTERHTPVRLAGVNWSGLETTVGMPGGLDRQDYHSILRGIANSGYNTVRIPFSNESVEHPTVPSAIRFENTSGPINGDLEGLNTLQILDHIVFAAGELGLKVILDNHRSESGSSAESNGLWYTDEYPEQAWIADWVRLAGRYRGNSTVIGFDLRNEPHNASSGGSCWDCGGARDWHLAAERAGNSILRVNPNLLIFVEGTDTVDGRADFWGGNLIGVRRSPVRLAVPDRVVYSPHVYGPAEFRQPWFSAETTPGSLMAVWRRNWGFINESGTAPVWIGEFGTLNDEGSVVSSAAGSEGQYFATLIAYLGSHPDVGWCYWGLNGEDRYGLLNASYTAPASQQKTLALARISPVPDLSSPLPQLSTPVGGAFPASQTSVSPVKPHAQLPRRTAEENSLPLRDAAPVRVQYSPPALAQDGRDFSEERGRARPQTSRAARSRARSEKELLAEQVRKATEQALRDLPPED